MIAERGSVAIVSYRIIPYRGQGENLLFVVLKVSVGPHRKERGQEQHLGQLTQQIHQAGAHAFPEGAIL